MTTPEYPIQKVLGTPGESLGFSPHLDSAQLDQLRRYGNELHVDEGFVLFAAGDDSYDLFVILDGMADVVAAGLGLSEVIASFGPSEFVVAST